MTAPDGSVRVGPGGVVLRDLSLTGTLDVLFDGRRIWSFDPERDGHLANGRRSISWPRQLRPYLDGHTTVAICEHVSGEKFFDAELTFGTSDGRIALVDPHGNELVLNKGGQLVRGFSQRSGESRRHLVDQVRKTLELLNRQENVSAYLCYGLLLGAIREGRILGHDDDGDVGYLSNAESPADVITESFELEREFHRNGWRTLRLSAGTFKVLAPAIDGGAIGIDVFASFYVGDQFNLMGFVRGTLDRNALLPLGQVTLEGQQLPAPASPEQLLELTYGPGWKVPDPAFKFVLPESTSRRLSGWMRGTRFWREQWGSFYATRESVAGEPVPTAAARWAAGTIDGADCLVDVGCGLGADAVWFAQQGSTVWGMDYAHSALDSAARRAAELNVSAHFRPLNLYELRQALAAGASLVHNQPRPKAVYARWLLESLTRAGRDNFYRFAAMVLRGVNGRLLTEVRLAERQGAARGGEFPGQWHEKVSLALLQDEIHQHGGAVESCERLDAGDEAGFRVPPRCRLVVTWNG